MKFQQLLSHRRHYNKFIQVVGADTKKNQEEAKMKQVELDFEEAIRKKIDDLRSSKTRMESDQMFPSAANKSFLSLNKQSPTNKVFLDIKKR